MYRIRKYEIKDYESVEKLCVRLAAPKLQKNEMLKKALVDVFCRYYIEKEPENCFVAVNGEDEVRGYIVCAKNYEVYSTILKKEYLNACHPVTKIMGVAAMEAMAAYAEEYPAHLHIDLYPDCQGKGIGRQMIKSLEEHLSKQGVKGVMLDVSVDNEGAKHFYEKCGFKVLCSNGNEILMGIKLNV